MAEFSGPDICSKSAVEVVSLLRAGEVSPDELIDAATARIAEVEPHVNAVPTLCEARARNAASNLADNRDHPGWLAGLPIGIKDLTPVKGVRTTFGTKGLADFIPETSDPLVERLEARGAVVLGKTNTPEMGAGGNTFNDVFGPTFNPWDTDLNAGGSSGGAAVSLATGEFWLSHGSDHAGSLRTPAAYNGIVGLRPSVGMAASLREAGWIAEGQEGPMARSVEDCALFLDAMSGFEPRVPSSFPAPDRPYREAVKQADGKVRIGYAPDLSGFSPVEPGIVEHMNRALSAVEANGGVVEEACPDLAGLEKAYHVIRGLGFATSARNMPNEIRRHVKATIKQNIAYGEALTIGEIADANIARTVIFNNMQTFLTRFDVLACATVGNMPRVQSLEWVDEVNGVRFSGYLDWLRFAFLATTTGLPAISVPIGLTDQGLPVGLQLIGPPRGEAKVLAVARAVEMANGGPLGPIDPKVSNG